LGCGPGNLTPYLLKRWPQAKITCVDSSAEMLDAARKSHKKSEGEQAAQVTYEQGDFVKWSDAKSDKVDIIFSNAALHWAQGHEHLLPKLFSRLNKPGGILAIQMPYTKEQSSHVLMKATAIEMGYGDLIKDVRIPVTDGPGPLPKDMEFYYKILTKLTDPSLINIWSTTYLQILDGDDPVWRFTRETGLKPVLQALGGEGSKRALEFEDLYRKRCAQTYPKADGKTLFPFTRFFVVASTK